MEANEALLDCYAKFSVQEIKDMSDSQVDQACKSEQMQIQSILASNKMTMTQNIKDRINVQRALNELGPLQYEYKTELIDWKSPKK